MRKPTKPTKPVAPPPNEFFVMVKRNYETTKRVVSEHPTRAAAQTELEKRRAYTGSFNYDNAELTVITLAEGKAIFGEDWQFGEVVKPKTPKAKVKADTLSQKS